MIPILLVLFFVFSGLSQGNYLSLSDNQGSWGSLTTSYLNNQYFNRIYSLSVGDFDSSGTPSILITGEGYYYTDCVYHRYRTYARLFSVNVSSTILLYRDITQQRLPNIVNEEYMFDSVFINRAHDNNLNIIFQGYPSVKLLWQNQSNSFIDRSDLLPSNTDTITGQINIAKFIKVDLSYPLDGLDDLIVLSDLNNLALIQSSNGSFLDQTNRYIGFLPNFVIYQVQANSGNYNNDGIWDIFFTGYQGPNIGLSGMLVGQSNGTFNLISNIIPIQTEGGVAFADLDGDGYDELSISGIYSNNSIGFNIYHNQRNGSFISVIWYDKASYVSVGIHGTIIAVPNKGNNTHDLILSGCGGVNCTKDYGIQYLYNAFNDTVPYFRRSSTTYITGSQSIKMSFFTTVDNFIISAFYIGSLNNAFNIRYTYYFIYGAFNPDTFSPTINSFYSIDKIDDNFNSQLTKSKCFISDINNNGCNDLIIAPYNDNYYYIFRGICNGTFANTPFTINRGAASTSLGFIAIDNFDNKTDHVGFFSVNSYEARYVSYYYDTGSTPTDHSFTPSINSTNFASGITLDLNQDDYLDLAWTGYSYNQYNSWVYLNNANKSFTQSNQIFLPELLKVGYANIVEVQPKHSILITGSTNNSNLAGFYTRISNGSYLITNNLDTFIGVDITTEVTNTVLVGRFNFDQYNDLFLLRSSISLLLLAQSNQTFLSTTIITTINLTSSNQAMITLLDLDLDGYPEIIYSNYLTDHIYGLKSQGNGIFTDISSQHIQNIGGFYDGSFCTSSFNNMINDTTTLVVLGASEQSCGFKVLISNNTIINETTSSSSSSGSTTNNANTDNTSNDSAILIGALVGSLGGATIIGLLACCTLLFCLTILIILIMLLLLIVLTVSLVILISMILIGFISTDALILFKLTRSSKPELGQSPETIIEQAKQVKEFEVLNWNDITLIKKLGEGAYGEVMLGQWNHIDVAVKLFKQINNETIKEFKHEAIMMTKVSYHPNVVRFIGAAFRNDAIAMVMVLCSGGSLLNALKEGRVNVEMKHKILYQTASAVAFLHSLGIIHRDIAARNILLDGVGNAKLSDLGLSRILENSRSEQNTASSIGPVRWMAPEAIKDRVYSSSTDCYSFGILMNEIWSDGETPYKEIKSLPDVLIYVYGGGRPTIHTNTPLDQEKLIRKLWLEQPLDRLTMEEVLGLLKSVDTETDLQDVLVEQYQQID